MPDADFEFEYISDLTEPEPVELVESNIATLSEYEQDRYLWRVELYLVSKYQPEFYEASVWKLYSAAKERAKIVKEHHVVIQSMSELQRMIESDLAQYAQWSPPKRYKYGSVMKQAPRPNIGRDYAQRQIE